jgi:hypothetical protein
MEIPVLDLYILLYFIDADELLYCPQAGLNITTQKEYQMQIHDEFVSKGIEEMRYVRIPYSGLYVPLFCLLIPHVLYIAV